MIRIKTAYFLLLFLFVLFKGEIYAQTKVDFKQTFEKADNLLLGQNYPQALPLFLQLDALDNDNSNIHFKIGICYLNLHEGRARSIPYLEKAVLNISTDYKQGKSSEKKAPPVALLHLGQAYHLDYKFDNAIEAFRKFKLYILENPELIKDVDRQIGMCNNGKIFIVAPIKIEIKNLGDKINTAYAEYLPVISTDEATLIFTSKKPVNADQLTENKSFEDIYISYLKNEEWTSPISISSTINTNGQASSLRLSADGQKLFIYKNAGGGTYTSSLIGDTWSLPQKLSENINAKEWEPGADLPTDGNTLYFSSDQKGGLGGKDIFISQKLPNGEWGLPINLGPKINTPYDEEAPFMHPNGKTLFFSSKGHNSMGGFDIFFSSINERRSWEKPVNIGYPVNTTGDDLFYVLSADGKRAYYSSFQEGGYGEKDIYQVTFLEEKEIPLALVKGTIVDARGNVPSDVKIIVNDNETGDIIGVYTPNAKTGNYLFILPPGKNYNVSYEAEGFLFRSENLDIPADASYFEIFKAIELSKIQIGQKMVLNNIFFDFNKASLRNISEVELNKLLKLMEKNPDLSVEISGHTDHKEINDKLSQERAEAVVNYIIVKGIDKSRLLARGYGKARPIASNTLADGSDNVEGMQLNRRVELQVLGIANK